MQHKERTKDCILMAMTGSLSYAEIQSGWRKQGEVA